MRIKIVLDHDVRKGAGNSSPHYEPPFQLFRRQKQKHTVISVAGANAPVVKKLSCVFVGIHAIKIFHSDDYDLRSFALLFHINIRVYNILPRFLRQHICRVIYIILLAF